MVLGKHGGDRRSKEAKDQDCNTILIPPSTVPYLTASQRAACALEAERHFAELAKERQAQNARATTLERTNSQIVDYSSPRPESQPKAAQKAAEALGTNRQYVSDAKKIAEQAPDLLPKVHSGELNIPQAKREVARREKKAAIEAKAREVEEAVFAAGEKRDLGWEIITGDCLQVMEETEIYKPRLIFADPPYNIGRVREQRIKMII